MNIVSFLIISIYLYAFCRVCSTIWLLCGKRQAATNSHLMIIIIGTLAICCIFGASVVNEILVVIIYIYKSIIIHINIRALSVAISRSCEMGQTQCNVLFFCFLKFPEAMLAVLFQNFVIFSRAYSFPQKNKNKTFVNN